MLLPVLPLVRSVLAGPVGVAPPAPRPVDWSVTALTGVVCVLLIGGLVVHATRPRPTQEDS